MHACNIYAHIQRKAGRQIQVGGWVTLLFSRSLVRKNTAGAALPGDSANKQATTN